MSQTQKEKNLFRPGIDQIPDEFVVGEHYPAPAFFGESRIALSALRLKIEKEREDARHDAKFPSFLNAKEWNKDIEKRISEGTEFGVIFIDFDSFNLVNNTLGHGEGDMLIESFGQMLEKHFRRNTDRLGKVSTDEEPTLIARYGGDEFGITTDLPLDRRREGETASDQMDKELQYFNALSDDFINSRVNSGRLRELGFGISAGAIIYSPSHPESPAQVKDRADRAMYEAKAKNKQGTLSR
ncbi:MAG: GGDEF domain-containing protein [Candidatus Saccharimonadales bacterium]